MSLTPLFSTLTYKSDKPFEIGDDLFKEIKSLPNTKNLTNKISEDLNVLNQYESLKKYCEKHLNYYCKDVLKINNEIFITSSWFNYTDKNESHHTHNHPNSIISGVIYFNNNSKICFVRKDEPFCLNLDYFEYNTLNSSTHNMVLNKGELIFFPSKLNHYVPVNDINETRISLSFNTFVKGKINENNIISRLEI